MAPKNKKQTKQFCGSLWHQKRFVKNFQTFAKILWQSFSGTLVALKTLWGTVFKCPLDFLSSLLFAWGQGGHFSMNGKCMVKKGLVRWRLQAGVYDGTTHKDISIWLPPCISKALLALVPVCTVMTLSSEQDAAANGLHTALGNREKLISDSCVVCPKQQRKTLDLEDNVLPVFLSVCLFACAMHSLQPCTSCGAAQLLIPVQEGNEHSRSNDLQGLWDEMQKFHFSQTCWQKHSSIHKKHWTVLHCWSESRHRENLLAGCLYAVRLCQEFSR